MADTANAPEIQSPPPVQKKNSLDENLTGENPPPVRKLSRSQSITSSTIPAHFMLPPEMESQWKKRRESLEKLQLEKVAPWIHLHDFSETEAGQESAANSP